MTTIPNEPPNITVTATGSSSASVNVPGSALSLPGYVIRRELGRGGMGVVYEAEHRQLNRVVALKVIKSGEFASEDELRRFRFEAEAAAQLDHPNIVPVHEAGQSDGLHYIAMGFVEGCSLKDRISKGTLPARQAAMLVKTIAAAVHYAHERGIIHRDLKPGNILLAKDARDQTDDLNPRITDFGLAKRLTTDSSMTATGQVVGTPSYMPPEQAAGLINEVGPLSDVYSLGAILYCTLTGQPPFKADHVVETLRRVLSEEPVAPRQINPEISHDLETICLKCLEKEPSGRYASAGQLADELERFLEGRPIVARPLNVLQLTERWIRRNQLLAALYAVLVAGLTVSSILAVKWRDEAEAAYQAREKVAEQSRDLSENVAKLKTTLKERDRAQANRQRQTCRNDMSFGQRECEQGRIDRGLFYYIRALESVPGIDSGNMAAPDRELAFTVRANIETWRRQLHVLKWMAGQGTQLVQHTQGVHFSPDGRLLLLLLADGSLVGGSGRNAQLWDTGSGRRIGRTIKHKDNIIASGFSLGGREVVCFSTGMSFKKRSNFARRAEIHRWNATTGEPVAKPVLCSTKWITRAAISRNGKWLLTIDSERVAGQIGQLWDLKRGEATVVIPAIDEKDRLLMVGFSPDEKFLVARCNSQPSFRAWDISTGKLMKSTVRENSAWRLYEIAGTTFAAPFAREFDQYRNPFQFPAQQELQVFDTALLRTALKSPPKGFEGILSARHRWLTVNGRVWDQQRRLAIGQPLSGHCNPVRREIVTVRGAVQCWYASGSVPKHVMHVECADGKPTPHELRLWLEVATGLELKDGAFHNIDAERWNSKRMRLRNPH